MHALVKFVAVSSGSYLPWCRQFRHRAGRERREGMLLFHGRAAIRRFVIQQAQQVLIEVSIELIQSFLSAARRNLNIVRSDFTVGHFDGVTQCKVGLEGIFLLR